MTIVDIPIAAVDRLIHRDSKTSPLRTISNQCARLQTAGCKELAQKHGSSQVDGSKVAMCVQQRPRTRSSVTLWSLPDSVLIRVLKELHIRDLLSFRSVHPHFLNVIDANSVLWKHVSFADAWPSEKNLSHFVNAAEKKNVEAALKLAVAYLYKEGLCKEDNPDMSYESAHYFCLAEILTPEAFPFFWIFVRPPWSLDGTCCKAKTFQHIQTIAEKSKHPDLCFGTGLTLKLQRLTSQGSSKVEEMKYFNIAVANKSKAAAFFILLDIEKQMDKAKELERVRMLRLISGSVLEANLFLIRHYVQGQYGGISRCMAQEYVQSCFQFSRPSRIHITYTQGQTSDISRYILVDWLVEVLGMKEYSTHTLYLAVSMFDRFMQVRKIQRSQVQLLGVAAMVLSSRYLGFNILTIREAAWLTDNSYSYQDVVRMMGELVAALGGNLRVLNIHDYVMVLAPLVGETCQSAMLMEYLAMLCLLQSEMGQYSPAEIAASSLLLARLLLNCADPWPAVVQEWTGFSQDYLSLCTFHIYNKCLLDGSEVDYRDTKLQAVKTRYADPNRYCISKIKIIHHKELCKRLGVAKLITRGAETKAVKFLNTDELIMSPSRGGQSQDFVSIEQSFKFPFENSDRKMSATPPISLSGVHDEPGSGYDADLDDISDGAFLRVVVRESEDCFQARE
ncbi:cyclin-f-like [Plakobranchus ocellatus]|uniref:Cyclin-F n=1 Tax=Plakobranchus ocellatus TaxID=259542 RepID=A0AAV4BH27_9GAST|nr:cyclin-f-like [Plakobranchus ocellatus]